MPGARKRALPSLSVHFMHSRAVSGQLTVVHHSQQFQFGTRHRVRGIMGHPQGGEAIQVPSASKIVERRGRTYALLHRIKAQRCKDFGPIMRDDEPAGCWHDSLFVGWSLGQPAILFLSQMVLLWKTFWTPVVPARGAHGHC